MQECDMILTRLPIHECMMGLLTHERVILMQDLYAHDHHYEEFTADISCLLMLMMDGLIY